MIVKKLIPFIFGGVICFSVDRIVAKDAIACPYDTVRYHEAFDQEALYKKYEKLMHQMGCASNVFFEQDDSLAVLKRELKSKQSFFLDKQVFAEFEQYQKDCINQLNRVRYIALAEPGIESGIYISLMGLAALVTIGIMGKDSVAGSYGAYSAIFSAADKLGGLGKSLYNLVSLPNNSLESLENYFAKNKCFIPKILWAKIINAFIDARQSDTLKEKNINFLKFALGFTLYKSQFKTFLKNYQSVIEIKDELNQRIDNFFSKYNVNNAYDDLVYIKINVSKFIDSLFDKNSKPSRYVYLHGLGGIGKTHFVQTLAAWIDELLPEVVHYQDLIVTNMSELEGDIERPGALLKVLRNQIVGSKIGSIVMLDEATWLNDQEMVSSAKRVFNGDRTRISTAYFGAEVDGSAVKLDMPAMLIFVASNDELVDPALASRFDIVHYPTPSKEALINYAYKITQESTILHDVSCIAPYDFIADWIETIDSKNLNFRYIAGSVEGYCLNNKASITISR
jgi:hypothetical protein